MIGLLAALLLSAPAFQAQGSIAADASPSADLTVTLPAHAAGDLIIVMALERSLTATITVAGYTALAATPFDRTLSTRRWVWWKVATSAAESDPVLDLTAPGVDLYGIAYTIRGADTTAPIEASGPAISGTSDPASVTGVTSLTDGSLIVLAFAGEDNNNAACTVTAANPAAFTEHYVETATGLDAMFCFSEATRATAGATGNLSVDFGTANPVGWGGIVMAVKPPAAAAADTFNDGTW